MTIKTGAIVSCFFPRNENPQSPGPDARPALVLGSFKNPREAKELLVIVAYGTTQKSRANLSFEIKIDSPELIATTGLRRPTRFTFNRLRILKYNTDYFALQPNGSAIIGMLPAAEQRYLQEYLVSLASHADQLNFFKPSDAMRSGKKFDPFEIDEYMQKNLSGTQLLTRVRRPGRNILAKH